MTEKLDFEIERRGDLYFIKLRPDIPPGELPSFTLCFTAPVDWQDASDIRPWERVVSVLASEILRLRSE